MIPLPAVSFPSNLSNSRARGERSFDIVRLPTLQDGRRLIAKPALKVPNVMPATVVLRARTVAWPETLPRPFTDADEIAAAVRNPLR